MEDYHPARLYYPGSAERPSLILARASALCDLLQQGRVDVIFTGEDYAAEAFEKLPAVLSVPFYEVIFALLGTHCDVEPVNTVYTKFPRTASKHLKEWNIAYREITAVSGASETFCRLQKRAVAFDVICTGVTKRMNSLHAIRQGPSMACAWYTNRDRFPPDLEELVSDSAFIGRVRDYYSEYLATRDTAMYDVISELL
jgi:ATP phosphoribosyltransferase